MKANPAEGYNRTRQIIRQGRLLITGMLSLVSFAIVAYALGRKFNVARLGFNSGLVLILVLGNSISLIMPGGAAAGAAVKVLNGYFMIALSNADPDKERNMQLLKERGWFDVPVVYGNNRRAILAIEKGTPGERAFAEAFKAWKQ